MSQYYVKTENSRGSLVTASSSVFAQAKLQTLREGVTRFNSQASELSQGAGVRVTLERHLDGSLHLEVRAESVEPIFVKMTGNVMYDAEIVTIG